MCTAVSYKAKGNYYGRTLDLEYSLDERVMITARKHPLSFLHSESMASHYALMGIGCISNGYPLYYDAVNECGVWMAGLNFPHFASYNKGKCGMLNLASYELLPFILGRCGTVSDALEILKRANITSQSFSLKLQATPMHWMLCDSQQCVVLEPLESGLRIYENKAGVLTNSPPFDYQMQNLTNYLSLTPYPPHSRFSDVLALDSYSNGMGAIGMPGDVSSVSRFVRASFTKLNAHTPNDEIGSVRQFFHILGSVAQVEGTVRLANGKLERTAYTCCCDPQKLMYYYTTYENSCVSAVSMTDEDLDSDDVTEYPLTREMKINMQNQRV